MRQLYDIPEMRQAKESKESFRERTHNIKHPLVEKSLTSMLRSMTSALKQTTISMADIRELLSSASVVAMLQKWQ